MPGDTITLRLEGEVTMDKLADALTKFTAVLNRLEQDRNANITWVVSELSHGSALATARAIGGDEASIRLVPTVCDDFLAAAREVSRGDSGSRPILRLVSNLTAVADDTNRVILETADDDVIFIAPATALPAPQPGMTKALGSVRGRVQTLSHRKELRFTLYELASDRAVSCYLQPGNEELMRDAWGRVADVTGVVTRYTETGRPIAVRQVTVVDVIDEGETMGFLSARGVVGGTEPAEAIIRRIRDAG